MRVVWWFIAVVAVMASGVLWLFVASELRARSVPVAPVAPLVIESSRLPVVPVLHPAGTVCDRGYWVYRRADAYGDVYMVQVRIDDQLLPCRSQDTRDRR